MSKKVKTYRDKKREMTMRADRTIWKALKIEKVVKVYGISQVKSSINHWITYQTENAKLLREKSQLESKLKEIESKL